MIHLRYFAWETQIVVFVSFMLFPNCDELTRVKYLTQTRFSYRIWDPFSDAKRNEFSIQHWSTGSTASVRLFFSHLAVPFAQETCYCSFFGGLDRTSGVMEKWLERRYLLPVYSVERLVYNSSSALMFLVMGGLKDTPLFVVVVPWNFTRFFFFPRFQWPRGWLHFSRIISTCKPSFAAGIMGYSDFADFAGCKCSPFLHAVLIVVAPQMGDHFSIFLHQPMEGKSWDFFLPQKKHGGLVGMSRELAGYTLQMLHGVGMSSLLVIVRYPLEVQPPFFFSLLSEPPLF